MDVTIRAEGHHYVSARHTSTFEFTADTHLTRAGDCILGIGAAPVPAEFPTDFVDGCQRMDATITATIQVGEQTEVITGRGDQALTFASDRSLVGRTSTYIDDRTVMVEADKAAADIDRALVEELSDGAAITCRLQVQ